MSDKMVDQVKATNAKSNDAGDILETTIHPAYEIFMAWMQERKRVHEIALQLPKEIFAYSEMKIWDSKMRRNKKYGNGKLRPWDEQTERKALVESYLQRKRSGCPVAKEWWKYK